MSPAVQRRIPAWLLSLALHLAALLVGTLLVRGTYLPQRQDEPERATSIVLARHAAPQTTQYFSEEDVEATDASAASPLATSATRDPLESAPPGAGGIDLPRPAAPVHTGSQAPVTITGRRGASRMGGLTAETVAAILADEAARAQNVGPSGPTAKVSLFGSAAAEGRSFVFLIDRSQSMGHDGLGAIAAAGKELAVSIDQLHAEHSFQVIAYNQKPLSLGGRELLKATPENKQKLVEFVASTATFGGTEHELGLFAALRFKPDVIFMLTDGGDPGLKPGQLRAIREAAAGRTVIHCLHFGDGSPSADENFLERLAAENGGNYVYIDMRER